MEQLQKESIKDRNEANIEKKPQGITEQKEEEEIYLKAKYCPMELQNLIKVNLIRYVN